MPSFVGQKYTVYEETTDGGGSLDIDGLEHRDSTGDLSLSIHTLTVVEQYCPPDSAGRLADVTGLRAVDESGVEWTSEWGSADPDAPPTPWTTVDGRRARVPLTGSRK